MVLSKAAQQEIRHERARRQWGLRIAARKAGIAVGTWSRIENGQGFDYPKLVALVGAFGWDSKEADRLLMLGSESSGDAAGPVDGPEDSVVQAIRGSGRLSAVDKELLLTAYRFALRTPPGNLDEVDRHGHGTP